LKYIGHKKAIEEVEKGLTQSSSHNVVLVAPEGSGKKTSVYGLARKMVRGESFRVLNWRHLLELDLDSLLAGAESGGAIISRINTVLSEAVKVGNVILFIDNFTNLLSSKGIGQVNAAEVLIPYLNSDQVYLIGSTTPGKYHRYIENNPSLNQRIKAVELQEPNKQEMIRIIEDAVPEVESRANCFFTYQAIEEIIIVADKYIFDQPNPQKSLNLLDKVAVESRGQKVTIDKVQEVASRAYKVPVGKASQQEKKKLLNLEEILHRRIVNQNQAVEEISEAMRRARAEIGQKGKKPIGSFLFLGPTGVGKTETAKALASSYFGGEDQMIRFDMSEYQNNQDVYRLLGSPDEDGAPGRLSEVLKQKPYSLLLFDEIEKAHPDILNLFLQILDEGIATNTQGNRLIFSNNIIIATSNAGSEFIRKKIKEGANTQEISEQILDYLMSQGEFKPEFLNRFTSVVSFSPLNRSQIEQIAKMKLDKLARKIKDDKDISLSFGERVPAEIASRGYNPEMGARPMERTIEQTIENLIAKKILSDDLSRGDSLTIKAADFEE
jgi:ATP-dependent Clp protease ATP-binding subunit ClpC